jgi:ribosomal protein RSM22 (predicted rRNA methylase)
LERELSKISPAELAGASAELTASYRTSGSQPAGHVKFQLCAREGLKAETISRKQKERYRAARNGGDSWSPLSKYADVRSIWYN